MSEQEKLLLLYQQCVCSIEDYFEYMNDSTQDKEYVIAIIDRMVDRIRQLQDNIKEEA